MPFHIDTGKIENLLSRRFGREDVSRALCVEHPSMEDFAVYIRHEDDAALEMLAETAKKITVARFGRVKGLYIPLYLSNSCHNACSYCGFSVKNKIERQTLKTGEIKSELAGIFDKESLGVPLGVLGLWLFWRAMKRSSWVSAILAGTTR